MREERNDGPALSTTFSTIGICARNRSIDRWRGDVTRGRSTSSPFEEDRRGSMSVEQPDVDRGQSRRARPLRVALAARRVAAGATAGAAGLSVALLAGATWSVALLVAWDIAAV